MAPTAKDTAQLKTSAVSVSTPDLESDLNGAQDQFVIGQWEVEIRDWRRHCIPNGWMVCFCPCVTLAQISARITPGSFRSTLISQLVLNVLAWGILAADLAFVVEYWHAYTNEEALTVSLIKIWACLVLILALAAFSVRKITKLRASVRERFQIPGSEKDDNKQARWCGTCAIAQMATQVKSYTPGSCDFYEPDALPAYIR